MSGAPRPGICQGGGMDTAAAPPIVSVEQVLAGIPRGARVLCLGLAGPAARVGQSSGVSLAQVASSTL